MDVVREHYTRRLRALSAANGGLHARIWRSRVADERTALRREIEANMRRMRETQYLMRHFLAHPDEFKETAHTDEEQRRRLAGSLP